MVRCSPGIPFSKNDHFLPGIATSTFTLLVTALRPQPSPCPPSAAREPPLRRFLLFFIQRSAARDCEGRHNPRPRPWRRPRLFIIPTRLVTIRPHLRERMRFNSSNGLGGEE